MATHYLIAHQWIRTHADKTGICEHCHAAKKTEWSNKSGEYRLERDDWQELCQNCHKKYDMQPHMRGAGRRAGIPERKTIIEATEDEFERADRVRRMIMMYKAKHRLTTKFQAAAAMIKETATREGLGL